MFDDYIILEETDRAILETKVKKLVKQGWIPYVNVQPVYKPDQRCITYVLQLVKLLPDTADAILGGP